MKTIIKDLSVFETDVIKYLSSHKYINQREISEQTGHSLGIINKSLKNLRSSGILNDDYSISELAKDTIMISHPKSAIILAAGVGMRMVPISMSSPKALIEIKGERIIERQIRFLMEVGINDITVVVGFMKESFEYLIDKYSVKLAVNEEYYYKNNLTSLLKVSEQLDECYIVPGNIWCKKNPFSSSEIYSWYLVGKSEAINSDFAVKRNGEIKIVESENPGIHMIGISYINSKDADIVRNKIKEMGSDEKNNDAFWETAIIDLINSNQIKMYSKQADDQDYIELNTYEQLRELDSNSNHLSSEAIDVISHTLGCVPSKIKNIEILKKGMTNRSFSFVVDGNKYIMRIPGDGTNKLINRFNEVASFKAISGKGLCDDPVYISSENGYKISKYLDNVRSCDPYNRNDLEICMDKLKKFHEMRLKVNHTFNLFGQIEFYESLWEGNDSVYQDYRTTKENVYKLKSYVESRRREICLTHIDAVPDNFLFYIDASGKEKIQLTDWEYAGMQDPHVDIAMFCIYSQYDREACDNLIDIYFKNNCKDETRIKIYCYIAICGLLWSNWCEYKRQIGVEFGEYSLKQYRYAKEYYRLVENSIYGG